MSRLHRVFIPLAAILWLTGISFGQNIQLAIDSSQRFQTIEGFGACLYLAATHPYDQPWYPAFYVHGLGAPL